jgi:hypothetical protein
VLGHLSCRFWALRLCIMFPTTTYPKEPRARDLPVSVSTFERAHFRCANLNSDSRSELQHSRTRCLVPNQQDQVESAQAHTQQPGDLRVHNSAPTNTDCEPPTRNLGYHRQSQRRHLVLKGFFGNVLLVVPRCHATSPLRPHARGWTLRSNPRHQTWTTRGATRDRSSSLREVSDFPIKAMPLLSCSTDLFLRPT